VVPSTVVSRKKYNRRCVDLELVPPRGEKHFEPRPQNRVLVPLRGSLHDFHDPPILVIWESLPGKESTILYTRIRSY